jgi:hypothetical protein
MIPCEGLLSLRKDDRGVTLRGKDGSTAPHV